MFQISTFDLNRGSVRRVDNPLPLVMFSRCKLFLKLLAFILTQPRGGRRGSEQQQGGERMFLILLPSLFPPN